MSSENSINHAAWKILANQADIMIAGGMESYSQAFVKITMAKWLSGGDYGVDLTIMGIAPA